MTSGDGSTQPGVQDEVIPVLAVTAARLQLLAGKVLPAELSQLIESECFPIPLRGPAEGSLFGLACPGSAFLAHDATASTTRAASLTRIFPVTS